MPKVALADSTIDWETLLANASQHADQPGLGERLDELRTVLARTRELDIRRARLTGERQQATQELAAAKEEGKRLASRIRSQLKAMYGATNGRLAGFGMKPRPSAKDASLPSVILSPPSGEEEPPQS